MHVSVYTPKAAPTTPPPSQPAAFSAVSSKGLPRQRVMTTAPTPAQVSSTLPVASAQQISPSGNVQLSPTQVSRRTQVSGQTAPTMSNAPTQVSPFEAGIGDRYGMDAPEYQWPEDVSETLEHPTQEVSAAPQQVVNVAPEVVSPVSQQVPQVSQVAGPQVVSEPAQVVSAAPQQVIQEVTTLPIEAIREVTRSPIQVIWEVGNTATRTERGSWIPRRKKNKN